MEVRTSSSFSLFLFVACKLTSSILAAPSLGGEDLCLLACQHPSQKNKTKNVPRALAIDLTLIDRNGRDIEHFMDCHKDK